jgi:hypothetical protein
MSPANRDISNAKQTAAGGTPSVPQRVSEELSRVSKMPRKCSTCQHIKRAEIDRRLAAGEPGNQIASDYDLNPSSLHRHRTNCLGIGSSNAIMKEVSRGTAAVACLPTKDDLGTAISSCEGRSTRSSARRAPRGRCRLHCPASTRSDIRWTACHGWPGLTGREPRSMSPYKPMCMSMLRTSPSA